MKHRRPETRTRRLKLRPAAGPSAYDHGVVSVPMPRERGLRARVDGSSSQAVTTGFWPRSEERPGGPRIARRSLLFFRAPADSSGAPHVLIESAGEDAVRDAAGQSPRLAVRDLENAVEEADETWASYFRAPSEVVLAYGDLELGLRLAVDNESGRHLWQYVVAERVWTGPVCEGWRVGGHIFTGDESRYPRSRKREVSRRREVGEGDLYRDHTVQASLFVVLFHDGGAMVTAHWINGRIYGGTGPVNGVPMICFHGLRPRDPELPRSWTGADPVIEGDAALDLAPAADLVSPEHPGRLDADGELLCWQPVADTRVTIRSRPAANDSAPGDILWTDVDGSSEGLVEGAARSVRFHLGLNGRPPRIRRFLAPRAWYGATEEFTPFRVEETVDGRWSELSGRAADVMLRNAVSGKFTSGAIFRYLDQHGKGTYEISMDANEARSLFRRAYWDGRADLHDLALRNAYFCADLAVDHARDVVHYHGDPGDWRIYSLIYMRFSGLVLGYLETGDPYLLETAQAVARNYASHHMLNWPRRGIGRDADPLTGILMLWDYTGDESFYDFGRTFAGHVASVIDDRGNWLSGSGVGPGMGINAAVGSSWNGGHFLSGFTEWLMRADQVGEPVPVPWLNAAARALEVVYSSIEERPQGFHPASTGFVGRIHWYMACRLQSRDLIRRTRLLLENIFDYDREPVREPLFTGGWAHHQNNFVDNLLFYQCTEESLPGRFSKKTPAPADS